MKSRRAFLAAASGAAALMAVGAVALMIAGPAPRFDGPTVMRRETVPGTLGLIVEAPPEGFVPSISEQAAFREAFPVDPPRGVFRGLGVIRDTTIGDSSRPSWIFVANAICYSSGKCTVVSAARSGFKGCTKKHLSLVAVDAAGDGTVRSYEGYDPSGTWRPDVKVA